MRLNELLSKKGKNYFYIMHLSYGEGIHRERLWNYAKNNNVIGLDYPRVVTDNWIRTPEEVRDLLPPIWRKQFNMFCYEMVIGDIVVILEGWLSLLGIAEVLTTHRYRRELSETEMFFDHVRDVRWLKKYDFGEHPRLIHPLKGFLNTLHRVERGTKRWRILSTIDPKGIETT